MDPSGTTTGNSLTPATLESKLPPVAVPATDLAATEEEDTFFAESEQHNLSVRKWAARMSLGLISLLYAAGLVLLVAAAVFSGRLCISSEPVFAEHAVQSSAPSPEADAAMASTVVARGIQTTEKDKAADLADAGQNRSVMASKESMKAASGVDGGALERSSSQSCANALALLDSHAMVGALIALFSIPTALLIVLLRAFASGKKEKAVPDTAISWLADKFAAGIEKLTGSKD